MKYLVRSIKYFLYLCIVLVVIILALKALHLTEGSIEDMFVNGYDSLWQMALVIAAFAAIYPKYGYGRRILPVSGNPADALPRIKEHMRIRGYVVDKEGPDGAVRFRKASILSRIARSWEDAVVFTPVMEGYELEGLTREIARIISANTELSSSEQN